MEEDYYSDGDEKVESIVDIYYTNKINNILKNAKKFIKDYEQYIVYLTQKQLNELYEGKPITLNLRTNINEPKTNLFEFLTKDRLNLPSVIYLSKDQIYKIFPNKSTKNKITLSKKQLLVTINEIRRVNKQIDSFFKELKDKYKIFDNLLNEQYDNFISNLMKYSSKTPMLESRKQKIGKVVKSLLEKTKRVGKYHQTLVNINTLDMIDLVKKCIKGNTKGDFTLTLYSKLKGNKKIYISIYSFSNKRTKKIFTII